ncbi:MAG: PBP1A family penicillin-binding protein, partial [Gemmatimonadales bacterium]|nr:PBP1A family penicillin-binding protein [Gemmatimonadales bacterium]
MTARPPGRRRRTWLGPTVRRRLVVAVLALGTFAVAIIVAAWTQACAGNACPSIEGLDRYDPAQASKVYAADGRLITDLGLERRTVVPLAEMAPAVLEAFLTTEDKRFYEHSGIDWYRVFGAAKGALTTGRVTGASTITMQLAGNLWPDRINRRDRSFRRKFREAKVALQIERTYSKDKILELYLNQIDLGNRAFGVEAAAQRYFGKSVRELNVAEAATLAAIPKGPGIYNPRRHPDLSVRRRNLIIGLLRDAGSLGAEDAERWKAYPLLLSSRSDFSGVADYFVEYIRQQLDARFGSDLYRQGLRIYTTLDLEMQLAAERALEAQLEAIENGRYGKFPHRTYAQWQEQRKDEGNDGQGTSPYLQGLVLTIEARTGYIRAMVGGRDFEDSKFNRVTQARRQPGSTFKPVVYSAAVESGIPLSRLVVDEPYAVEPGPGQELWQPQNYDNRFDGTMTLRRALFESRNIPAVKLGREIGEETVVAEARKFGLTTPILAVPSVHLGSADVMPLEMIAAYTAFANLGERTVPSAVLRVEDRSGRIVWQPGVRREPVLPPEAAWLLTDVLRDVVRRGTAAGTVGAQITFPAGGKTGTTNDGMDVWFVGFTPDLVTGVWIGFDQPRKIMANAQGGRLAAPAWTTLMREVYERRPVPAPWGRPDGLTVAEIDRVTGQRATERTPIADRDVESFIPGTEPGGSNIAPPTGPPVPAPAPAPAPAQPTPPAPPAPP